MAKKQIKANRVLNKVIKLTLGTYLRRQFNVHYQGLEMLKNLRPPYVILGNHTNFWDPFFVASMVPSPVYFVTSDEYFRNLFLKILLGWAGAIPKMKFVSDAETVKNTIKVKNRNEIIGIFPEGRRNWDGTTLEILYPTAKLIKTLKAPVVIALLQGAALSFPRWAKKARRGKLTVMYQLILTTEEVTNLPTEDIYRRICAALNYDEYEWQQQQMLAFQGPELAEHLELFLFTCPNCRSIGTLTSHGEKLFCRQCGYTTRYNQYGFFESDSDRLYFANPRDWNRWQLDELKTLIDVHLTTLDTPAATPILTDGAVDVLRGYRMQPLKKLAIGQIALFSDRLELLTHTGERINFPIVQISGINIQYNDQFEFYYNKTLYRFIFQIRPTSAYKWVQAVRILQNTE